MDTTIKKQNSIDIIRYFAALGIILLHSFLEKNDPTAFYCAQFLGRWCVGFFFLITGYFLKNSFRDVAKYCLHILCLYIPASVLYALYLHIDIWSVRRFIFAMRNGVIMPFWYFPSLILCVLFVTLLRRLIQNPVIVCGICAILFLFALMGDTWCNVDGISRFMDSCFFPVHERIMGVHQTRDGIFNGSFYLSLGILLRERPEQVRKITADKKRVISLCLVALILHLAEIAFLLHFSLGELDVMIFEPVVDSALLLLGLSFEITKTKAVLLRKMSTVIFLIHYFFLEIYHGMFRNNRIVFWMTLASCMLLSYLVCKIIFWMKQR